MTLGFQSKLGAGDAWKSRFLRALGPGLITGASDDDPSGIATYSQAGAQFGYAISWTLLLTYPLMCSIQEISARIGRATGRGIAGNIRQHYPGWLLQAIVAMLGLFCAVLQIFMKYTRYVAVLKWLTLALFAYFGTAMTGKIPWGEVARGLIIPTLHYNSKFWMMVVAIFGTTISPYLFFWQASQEAEDTNEKPHVSLWWRRQGKGAMQSTAYA